MFKRLFHPLFLIALFFTTCLLNTELNAQGLNSPSKPRYTEVYQHDGVNWQHSINIFSKYNHKGLLLQEIETTPLLNDSIFKRVYTYDSLDNQRTYTTYDFVGLNWVFRGGTKDTIIYNQAGKKALHVVTIFRNGSWGNWDKWEYTYDANNNLIEEIYYWGDTTSWDPNYRFLFTYDANNLITQKQQFNNQNGAWILYVTENYSGWHIPNILPSFYTQDIAIVGFTQKRHIITMGSNGGYTDLRESFIPSSNTWRGVRRLTYTNDSRGNLINNLSENFNTGTWQVTSERQNIISYSPQFDITQLITRYPDPGVQNGGPVKDRFKYIYSNFQSFAVSGISKAIPKELAASIYPNPASGFLTIDLTQEQQALTVSVADLTGKTVLRQNFTPTETKQLNLEKLNNGIYLLHLETKTGKTVRKFIKN